MPNKNYLRGRRLEWQVKKDLEKAGWTVMRASGSHGVYDLVAIYTKLDTHIKFIQCKVTATPGSIKGLLKKFGEESPIKQCYSAGTTHISADLAVKVTGKGEYVLYPLGE